jgi:hypothetical protein
MRRLLLVVPLCFFLAGCHQYWGASNGPSNPDAESSVRAAIPAIEAWYADHDTYEGMTVDLLKQQYDAGLEGIKLVEPLNNKTYCVESTGDGPSYFKAGPAANIQEGHCGDAVQDVTEVTEYELYDAQMTVRSAIPAIEAWNADHGTYAGMTTRKLRSKYDYGISPELEVVRAAKKGYCVQATVDGETYSFQGPVGRLVPRGC